MTASTTTSSTTISPPATISTTTSPPSTTEANPIDWPVDAQYIVYGRDGMTAVTGDGALVKITTEPTAIAIGVRDDVVVSQAARTFDSTPLFGEGPIMVTDATGKRTLDSAEGEEIRLYDATEIDGRIYALAAVVTGYGPEETKEHLMLIDVVTSQRIDLGEAGGWEALTADARVAGDTVVIAVGGLPYAIEARSLDGTVLWTAGEPSFDRTISFVTTDNAVLEIMPEFRGDDFTPVLFARRFSLGDGSRLEPLEVELDAAFGGGFCLDVDWDGTNLVCSESYGGPFSLDVETGHVEPFSGFTNGAVRAVKR